MAELVVLGSGTGVPSLRRGSPGHLLVSESSRVLIDSGPGTLRRMLEAGVTYQDVDLILCTNINPDHVADLVQFIFASKYAACPRDRDLLCVGGPGFTDHFEKLKMVYGSWIKPQTYRLITREMCEESLLYQDLQIHSKTVAHIPESVGGARPILRLDFGKMTAYEVSPKKLPTIAQNQRTKGKNSLYTLRGPSHA